jgi:hypothetical protein
MRRLIVPFLTIALLGYLIIPKLDMQRLPLSMLSADMMMKGSGDMGMTYQTLVDNALAFQDFTQKNPQSEISSEAAKFIDNIRANVNELPKLKLFEFFPLVEWLTPNHYQEGIVVTALIYMQENPEFITEEVRMILSQPNPYSTALQGIINQTLSLQMGQNQK